MADVQTTVPGISTVGVRLAYCDDMETFTAPAASALTLLTRINNSGDVNLDVEEIDASALEDYVTKYIQGRQDTGGSFTVTINLTDATIGEWEAIKGTTKVFEEYYPGSSKAFWVRATVPPVIPKGEAGQNELKTVEIELTLIDVFGWKDKVTPSV